MSVEVPTTVFETSAVEAALAGGEVLERRFREPAALRVETKGRHDYVTEVDREAEAAVVGALRRLHPAHGILAEEGSSAPARGGWRWIVDPLDGTTNFIHGVATFAVSVALEGPEGLVAGVVHDPMRAETFHAARGQGAKLNGVPIRCGAPASLDAALIATGFPFREMSRLPAYLAAFEKFVRGTSGLRRAGSASLDLAYTACGRYDGFWEIGLSPWDIAAGALLVVEAGGRVCDAGGGRRFLEQGSIVASGPTIHDAMVAITSATLA
jgi:myo-inositol-1(or 4)-monophosphatase